MTFEEFANATPAEVEELEYRRDVDIKHARFNTALVVSVMLNSNRDKDDEPVSPFDFIAGCEKDPDVEAQEKRRKMLKRSIADIFLRMETATAQQVQARKASILQSMHEEGIEDPEGIFREVFPNM